MPSVSTFTVPVSGSVTDMNIDVVRDERTVVTVSDGNDNLRLSISATTKGDAIVQIPSTGGQFDITPLVVSILDEGVVYRHDIWDYTSYLDPIRIGTGAFICSPSIAGHESINPLNFLTDGARVEFVTQAEYDALTLEQQNAADVAYFIKDV